MLRILTTEEVNMLATLLARAGFNKYEVVWANDVLARLHALADANNKEGPQNEQPATQSGV